MDLLRIVGNYIQKHHMIKPGEVVLVAVSGGPDSVALLHLLHRMAEEGDFTIHVAHLNHMFRGAEADADADFVSSLAVMYGLPATIESIDVPAFRAGTGLSAQAAARDVRYGFLLRTAERHGAGKIALAHHADDQAETILMNFMRGAGTGGLKGIAPVRDNLFIRPLLSVRRAQIEEYCHDMGLPTRMDASNAKPVYLRNRVRMDLLPYLANNYNGGIVEALLRQAEICREEDAYLHEQACDAYDAARVSLPEGGIGLLRTGIKQMPLAILRRVLRMIWRDLTGAERDLSFAHVEYMAGLHDAGARFYLPGGITAVLSYQSLDFYTTVEEHQVGFYQHPINVPGVTYIPELQMVLHTTLLTAEHTLKPALLPLNEAFLDLAKMPSQLYVRQRLPGDVFQPYGQKLPMKLKNFFINQKIPRNVRDTFPLICTTKDIIWVAGLRVGEKWKITENTENILYARMETWIDH